MSPAGDVTIRAETTTDHSMIRRVNEEAFGGTEEADLVESLRRDGDVLLSLVAELDGRIVGHILFSRMSIETRGWSDRGGGARPPGGVASIPTSGHRRAADSRWRRNVCAVWASGS